jgi:hypothetical protein
MHQSRNWWQHVQDNVACIDHVAGTVPFLHPDQAAADLVMCMDDLASAEQLPQDACAAAALYTHHAQSSTAQDLDASTCIRRSTNSTAETMA